MGTIHEDTARLAEACSPWQQHAQVWTANTMTRLWHGSRGGVKIDFNIYKDRYVALWYSLLGSRADGPADTRDQRPSPPRDRCLS
jgi:hypothetical protein